MWTLATEHNLHYMGWLMRTQREKILSGVQDLKRHLSQQPRKLARSLATQLILYATGTPIRFSERENMEDILDQCANRGYLTRDIFHAVIQSQIFTGVKRD